jgi:hypothetical protein
MHHATCPFWHEEKSEDIKRIIRSRKSKKERQYNDQKKIYKFGSRHCTYKTRFRTQHYQTNTKTKALNTYNPTTYTCSGGCLSVVVVTYCNLQFLSCIITIFTVIAKWPVKSPVRCVMKHVRWDRLRCVIVLHIALHKLTLASQNIFTHIVLIPVSLLFKYLFVIIMNMSWWFRSMYRIFLFCRIRTHST